MQTLMKMEKKESPYLQSMLMLIFYKKIVIDPCLFVKTQGVR